MGFDPSTARPVGAATFDPSTAKPVSDSLLDDTLDVAGEFANAASLGALEMMEIVPSAVNAGLRLSGSEKQIPLMSDAYKKYFGEGGYMEEGAAKELTRVAGQLAVPAAGMNAVQGRNLAKVGPALAEFHGFGTGVPASHATKVIGDEVIPPTPKPPADRFPVQRAANERTKAVLQQQGDNSAAGYKVGPSGSVVKDPAQKKALSTGIEEGVVAQVASSTPRDKKQMGKMLEVVKNGLKNRTYAHWNLPRQVLGDSMYSRYAVVKKVREKAGKQVAAETARLKGKAIDLDALDSGPFGQFATKLDEMDVKINGGELEFKGSRFQGAKNGQRVLNEVFDYVKDNAAKTDHDVHKLKEFIDETLGEMGGGDTKLAKRAEGIVLDLRKSANDYLRDRHPAYAKANDTSSETIAVMNEIEELIGKKNTTSASSLARIARRALSNAQSSDRVLEMIERLDEVASKHGADFGDDIKAQMSFVQSLEKMFPNTQPPASIGGTMDKATTAAQAGRALRGSTEAMGELAIKGGKKVFGKTQEQQLQEWLEALEGLTTN